MSSTNALINWAQDHIVHSLYPVGQKVNIVIEKGHGIMVQDTEGKEYIDGSAQLTCVNLGYGRSEIIDAIIEQLHKLQYTKQYFGFSNPVVIECAKRLSEIMPTGLTSFVFNSTGAESIEDALSIARLFWRKKGKPKYKIISLYNAYHGISIGAISATGVGKGSIWTGREPLPPGFIHIPDYDCYYCMLGMDYPQCNIQCAKLLDKVIENEGSESVAAFIAEPVHGVAGIIPPPPEYWPMVKDICKKHDVLLIADEVMTGFCRTGKMFAVEHWGVKPDIMAMAKGITSAYLPFGATAFTDEIFDTLRDSYIVGHTYGGHPVCAAAAIKTMELYTKDNVAENVRKVEKHVLERLNTEFKAIPCVDNIGGLGLLLGFNVVKNKANKTPFDPTVARSIETQAADNGLLIRVMNAATSPGSRVCFSPPLTITIEETDRALDILKPIIASLKTS